MTWGVRIELVEACEGKKYSSFQRHPLTKVNTPLTKVNRPRFLKLTAQITDQIK